MKKILGLGFILLMSLLLLVSCGDSKQGTSGAYDKISNTLVIYSPHKADMINPIIKEFQETTGIKVELVAAGTGELLKRIESESNNPLGDIMWGGGAESLNAFGDFFTAYESPETAYIDSSFIGANHIWTGTSPLPMVIMYNKKLVKPEDVPRGWEDLLDSKWTGKIAYADPTRSGSSFTILATMLEAFKDRGDDGWVFIRDFYKNLDGKLISGSSGVYKGVSDGEYSVGLTLEKAAMEYVNAGADVGIVYPKEGTSSAPDGIAIIKGAKNINNAKVFFDFVLKSETQKYVYENFASRPVRNDIELSETMLPISDIKLVDYDLEWVSANKEFIVKKWKDIVIGKY